ncbi:MAG: hypothetical protein WB689_08800, partial [Xanthobacteraceae bacterium]
RSARSTAVLNEMAVVGAVAGACAHGQLGAALAISPSSKRSFTSGSSTRSLARNLHLFRV